MFGLLNYPSNGLWRSSAQVSFYFFFSIPSIWLMQDLHYFFLCTRISLKAMNWQYLNISGMLGFISAFCFLRKVLSLTWAWRTLFYCRAASSVGFRCSMATSLLYFSWYAHFPQSSRPRTPWCCHTAWKGKKWVNISLEDHLNLKIQVELNGWFTNVSKYLSSLTGMELQLLE